MALEVVDFLRQVVLGYRLAADSFTLRPALPTAVQILLRRLYRALSRASPQARWTEAEGFPCAGTYVGPEAIRDNVFVALGRLFDGFTFTLDTLLDAGSHAVGVGSYSATSKATGKSFNARVVHLWTVEDGKVVRFEQFADTAIVARAMR